MFLYTDGLFLFCFRTKQANAPLIAVAVIMIVNMSPSDNSKYHLNTPE